MNKQTRNFMVTLVIVLLLAACGGAETAPTPELAATEIPTSTSEPVEVIPTAVLSEGTDSEQFGKYIGLVYPPSPAGLSQGFCINRSKPHSKIGHVAHRDRSMPHS